MEKNAKSESTVGVSVQDAYEVVKNDLIEKIEELKDEKNIGLALGLSEEWFKEYQKDVKDFYKLIVSKPTFTESIGVILEKSESLAEALFILHSYSQFVNYMKSEDPMKLLMEALGGGSGRKGGSRIIKPY